MTAITIFETGPNTEHLVIDLLNLAECLVMVVLCRQNKVTHYFQEA